ncbi:MAG TPA: hypothetical protein VFG42_09215 [Baekduia sp.]|uniref:hypothetical protein n=1 Tax=Baekduia sp. TaxID=2600305 RepID=UPI002D76D2AE|nr:hypothetical protein [Baekduia sp.]HET6506956.1 hypothetical protein [Baekduia sp.]
MTPTADKPRRAVLAVILAGYLTFFDAAGPDLAGRVSAALSGATVLLALALAVTLLTALPARRRAPAPART